MRIRHPSGGQAWSRRFGASRGRRSAACYFGGGKGWKTNKECCRAGKTCAKGGTLEGIEFRSGWPPASGLVRMNEVLWAQEHGNMVHRHPRSPLQLDQGGKSVVVSITHVPGFARLQDPRLSALHATP